MESDDEGTVTSVLPLDLETRLIWIELKLDRVLAILERVAPQTQHMEQHVAFVDSVYDSVRDRLGRLFGRALPAPTGPTGPTGPSSAQ